MPYKNPYNEMIAQKIQAINENHINKEIEYENNPVSHDILSSLEHSVTQHNNYTGGDGHKANIEGEIQLANKALLNKTREVGGSGYGNANATVRDEGIESIKSDVGGKKPRKKKADVVASGISGAGSAGAGSAGAGYSAARFAGAGVDAKPPKKAKKARTTKGGLLSLASLDSMTPGQPPDAVVAKITKQAKPPKLKEVDKQEAAAITKTESGGAKPSKAVSERNILVKKIMAERKLSLPAASKYIKENNLFVKKQ